MSTENWTHLFKPEARSKGQTFVSKDKVSPPRPSDTEVQVFVRDSSGAKVTLRAESIESDTLSADCNCAQSKKGQFCKHIWAALLTIEEKTPDFLESKTELVKADSVADLGASGSGSGPKKFEPSPAQVEKQEAYKQKQNEYRREQYQKQKQRLKDKKQSGGAKESRFGSSIYPSEVEDALKYFSANGFPLEDSLDEEAVSTAKKQLSRVFHPDKGGSHDEILELNQFTRILEEYLRS